MSAGLRYYGGKTHLVPQILRLLPAHNVHVEPFGGSAALLLAKPPVALEVINDLNLRLINFYRVLRAQPQELVRQLEATPYSRREYEAACERSEDPVEDARHFVILSWQSVQGAGTKHTPGQWRRILTHDGVTFAGPSRRWQEVPAKLSAIAHRLQGVQIDCRDALQILQDFDRPTTLFFIDAPYHKSVRASYDEYEVEPTEAFHEQLLKQLNSTKAMVVLCGFPNELYDRELAHWDTTDMDKSMLRASWPGNKNSEERRRSQVERIWRNEVAVRAHRKAMFVRTDGPRLQTRIQGTDDA